MSRIITSIAGAVFLGFSLAASAAADPPWRVDLPEAACTAPGTPNTAFQFGASYAVPMFMNGTADCMTMPGKEVASHRP